MFNQIFDNAVLNDVSIVVEPVDHFAEQRIAKHKTFDNIVYEKGQRYYDLKKILDNKNFTEDQKIEFLEAALEDETNDGLKYINSTQPKFWQTNVRGRAIAEEYFRRKDFDNSDNKHVKYNFFNFKTLNLYPESEQLIDQYIANRNNLEIKHPKESSLLIIYIQLGAYAKAIDFLKVLLHEFDGHISHSINRSVFQSLIFSDDALAGNLFHSLRYFDF